MSSGFTAERDKPAPGNLKERIAALQQKQRSVSPSSPVSTGASPNAGGGGLRAKIAKFEEKGSVPAPRTAFGLGVPIADQQRTNRELIGNRVPGVNRPIGAPNANRSSSPLLNTEDTPPPSLSRRTSRDYSVKSDTGSDRPDRPELESFEKKRRRVSLASDSLGGHPSANTSENGLSPTAFVFDESFNSVDPPSPSPDRRSSFINSIPKTPDLEEPKSPIPPPSPSIVVSSEPDPIPEVLPVAETVVLEPLVAPAPVIDAVPEESSPVVKPPASPTQLPKPPSPAQPIPPPIAVPDVFFNPPPVSSPVIEDSTTEKTPRSATIQLPVAEVSQPKSAEIPTSSPVTISKLSPTRRRTSPLPSPTNPDNPPNIPLPPVPSVPPTPPSGKVKAAPSTRRAKSNPSLLTPTSPSPYDGDGDDGDYGSVIVHAKGYTEPNLSTPLPAKPTFSAVVHQKVTQSPPRSATIHVPRSREQATSRRQTMSHAIVTPSKHDSAAYGDLAELLSEAAMLEEKLSRKESGLPEDVPPPVPAHDLAPRSATPETMENDDDRPPPLPPKTFSSGMRSTFRKMTGGARLSIFSDGTASSSSASQETAPTSIEHGYLLVTEEGYTKSLSHGSMNSSQSSVRSKQSAPVSRSKSLADRLFNRSRTKSVISHLDTISIEEPRSPAYKSPNIDTPTSPRHLGPGGDSRPQSWQSASSTATVSVIDAFPSVPETLPSMVFPNGQGSTRSNKRHSSYSTYEQTYSQAYQNGQLNNLQTPATAGDTYQYQYVGSGGRSPSNASNPQLS